MEMNIKAKCNRCDTDIVITDSTVSHLDNLCDQCSDELYNEHLAEMELEERMRDCYHMDEGGFCDGFTR